MKWLMAVLLFAVAITALGADVMLPQVKAVVKPTATPNHTVALSWTQSVCTGACGSVTGNKLYRGTATGGETLYQTFATPTVSYTDATVVNGTTYYYYVTGVSAGGESTASNEVSAVIPPTPVPPAAPVMSPAVVN